MNSNKSFEYYSRPSQRNYVSLRRSEQISHRPSDLLNNPRWCRVGIYWSSLARMIWFTLWRFALITLITKKTERNRHSTFLFCLFFTCSFSVLRFRDFQIGAFCPWQTEETTSLKPWQLDLSLLGCSRCVWQRQLCSDAAQCAKLLLLCL